MRVCGYHANLCKATIRDCSSVAPSVFKFACAIGSTVGIWATSFPRRVVALSGIRFPSYVFNVNFSILRVGLGKTVTNIRGNSSALHAMWVPGNSW